MESETRSLKCLLTDEEKRAKADEAAKLSEDLAAAQAGVDTAKGAVKTAQAHCDSIEATIMARLDTYKKGWESRQVECHWRPDKSAQVKRLVRSDTGEVIETKDIPAQQTIDGVATSKPRAKRAPELEGVDVGQNWGDGVGHVVTVVAVSNDSVVVALSDKTTLRITAEAWAKYHRIETIVDLIPGGIAPEFTPIEKSENGQTILRALDREGKTVDEIVVDAGLDKPACKGILSLFVERGFVVTGTRATGKAGKPPTTYAITEKGEEQIAS